MQFRPKCCALVATMAAAFLLSCSGGEDPINLGDTEAPDHAVSDATGDATLDGVSPLEGLVDQPNWDLLSDHWSPDADLDLHITKPDAGHPDLAPDQVLPPDVTAGLCLEPGSFGCDCSSGDDCLSDWCVETLDGLSCTMTCVEECPDGWTCTQVQEPPDVVYACMPVHSRLCRPCGKNQECQGVAVGSKTLCVDMGAAGAFCGGDCSEDGFDCPAGFHCKSMVSVEGDQGKQCVPEDQECTCSTLAVEQELSTGCYFENEFGLCQGDRQCTSDGLTPCSANEPGPEICNGEDDDCDGVADDDLVKEECEVTNQWGACPGTVLCVGGDPICQGKEPSGEICDGLDNNCDGQVDEGFGDCDNDGISDCIENDDDADGWPDEMDNCPCNQNPNQLDTDQDTMGDACDVDDDNDGIADEEDCQPLDPDFYPNAPEACNGLDDDCDDLIDEGFLDTDQDGEADCVDLDDDGDKVPDTLDNCPGMPNEGQLDTDFDSLGDACDPDDDGDNYGDDNDCDPKDKFVYPGAAELCDCKDNNCDGNADEGFTDTDGDGIADCCEDDTDGDTVPNGIDNCPYKANVDQLNSDGDLQGDACDPDDDNDGVVDEMDCNPTEVKAYPNAPEICDGIDNDCDGTVDNGFLDFDDDGLADCVDVDDDGDNIPDGMDVCPFFPDPLQLDTDGDGFGNECDGDDDGDGDFDLTDCEPLNPLINHGSAELCNGKDDNCDGNADEAGAAGCIQLFPDEDGDGFGASGEEKCLCKLTPPYTSFQGGDCDDNNEQINPLMNEICNGLDDNCDGKEGEECAPVRVQVSVMSAGMSAAADDYHNQSQTGIPVASGRLEGDSDFSLEIGFIPTTLLGQ